MKTIEDSVEGERVARALLEGSGFSAFSFSTQFILRFSRSEPGAYAGNQLPTEVELVLHGSWRFGTEEEWREQVARLAPEHAAEPEEPVQAYELAQLRWTSGSAIQAISIANGVLSIQFKNHRTITALADVDEADASWAVGSVGAPEALWSVSCAGQEIFVRAPHIRDE